ncbi:MAG: transglutaminase family protein [Loktanella sp.]|nr:transglutaminase family protein [Loktanella sp.]
MRTLNVTIAGPVHDPLLAPTGTATPYETVTCLSVTGGEIVAVTTEPELALGAALIQPQGGPVTLHYAIDAPGEYPEAAFAPRANRYTSAAAALAEASRAIAQQAGGGRAGIAALVAEAEARFAYAHPKRKFNDGMDTVPYLSCGLTEGSCVDINTYLVASLRAAGYEAAYIYGYFFPQERGGMTDDGHCWVVTRHAGEVLEWDIAHHLKANLGPTRAGLNPRRGERVALTHSMGHCYDLPGGPVALKLLGEPMLLAAEAAPAYTSLVARLSPVAPTAT